MPTATTANKILDFHIRTQAKPSGLLLGQRFHLLAVLNFIDEDLRGLKAGDVMLIDHDGGIPRNVPGNFFLTLLVDETSEAAHVDIMTVRHVGFHNVEECLHARSHIGFIDAGFLCDLIDNISLRHGR